jgi:2'-5' RNA ligase
MGSSFRGFIAVDLSERVREALRALSAELAAGTPGPPLRWVRPESIHLTLQFLGETDEAKAPQIAAALDDIAADSKRFTLGLGELGCFPNPRRPRVVWVGVAGETEALGRLQARVERAMAALGWEPEKRAYQAHLTLGRVKDGASPGAVTLPWGRQVDAAPIPITAVNLYQSVLRPEGAIYSVRHRAVFGGRE